MYIKILLFLTMNKKILLSGLLLIKILLPVQATEDFDKKTSFSVLSFSHNQSVIKANCSDAKPFKAGILNVLYHILHKTNEEHALLFEKVNYQSWVKYYKQHNNRAESTPERIVTWLDETRNHAYRELNERLAVKVIKSINEVILEIYGGCWGFREARGDDNIEGLKQILQNTISSSLNHNREELRSRARTWGQKTENNQDPQYLSSHYETLIIYYARITDDYCRSSQYFEGDKRFVITLENNLLDILKENSSKTKLTIQIINLSQNEIPKYKNLKWDSRKNYLPGWIIRIQDLDEAYTAQANVSAIENLHQLLLEKSSSEKLDSPKKEYSERLIPIVTVREYVNWWVSNIRGNEVFFITDWKKSYLAKIIDWMDWDINDDNTMIPLILPQNESEIKSCIDQMKKLFKDYYMDLL